MTPLEALTPKVHADATFICYACCNNGALYCKDGVVVWDCPDHMLMRMRGTAVISAQPRGVRH